MSISRCILAQSSPLKLGVWASGARSEHPACLSMEQRMPATVRVGVLPAGESEARKVAATATKFLREKFPDTPLRSDLGPPPPDIAIVIGPDRYLLRVLREAPRETAILAVGGGFHSEVSPHDITDALERLFRGEHWVEERLRLSVQVGGRFLAPAFNEIT